MCTTCPAHNPRVKKKGEAGMGKGKGEKKAKKEGKK